MDPKLFAYTYSQNFTQLMYCSPLEMNEFWSVVCVGESKSGFSRGDGGVTVATVLVNAISRQFVRILRGG